MNYKSDHKAFDVLPPHERENWQEMMDWSYMHDDHNTPRQFWGESPKFLSLTLEQWVAMSQEAPEVVAAFDLKLAIDRWRDHGPSGDDKYDYLRALAAQARQERWNASDPQLDASTPWLNPDSNDDVGLSYAMDCLWCPTQNTELVELLIKLIERNPRELVAYMREFVANDKRAEQRERELDKHSLTS